MSRIQASSVEISTTRIDGGQRRAAALELARRRPPSSPARDAAIASRPRRRPPAPAPRPGASCRAAPARPSSSRRAARTRPACGSRRRRGCEASVAVIAARSVADTRSERLQSGAMRPRLRADRRRPGSTDSPARAPRPPRSASRFRIARRAAALAPRSRRARARRSRPGSASPPREGARLVCLQELTLSPLLRRRPRRAERRRGRAGGAARRRRPTGSPRAMASETGVHVHASLYERADGRRRARLQHGDRRRARRRAGRRARASCTSRSPPATTRTATSAPGPAAATPFPLLALGDAQLGLPTCWDQWFPELARAYSLEGADVLVYPTAIGSEPDHPDFDTQPLWEQVIVGNGIANGAVHGRRQPHRRGAAAALLRLLLHLRSLRPQAGAGAARRAGGAGRRPRPRPARATGSSCFRS